MGVGRQQEGMDQAAMVHTRSYLTFLPPQTCARDIASGSLSRPIVEWEAYRFNCLFPSVASQFTSHHWIQCTHFWWRGGGTGEKTHHLWWWGKEKTGVLVSFERVLLGRPGFSTQQASGSSTACMVLVQRIQLRESREQSEAPAR